MVIRKILFFAFIAICLIGASYCQLANRLPDEQNLFANTDFLYVEIFRTAFGFAGCLSLIIAGLTKLFSNDKASKILLIVGICGCAMSLIALVITIVTL